MRSAVVLMTGFALLVVGIIVLALLGATLLGVALIVVGLVTKIGALLLGDPSTRGGRTVTAHGHDRRRAS